MAIGLYTERNDKMDSCSAMAMGEASRGKPVRVFDWDKAGDAIFDGAYSSA